MFSGFKTFAAGLALAVGPALAQYAGGFDFTHAFGLSPAAGAVIGTAMIALRAVTSSPIFTAK